MKNKLINSKALIWTLFALFFFLPYERIPTLEVEGFTLKISYIFGLILMVYVTSYYKSLNLQVEKSDIFLGLFLTYGFVSLAWTSDIKRGFVIWLLWLFVVLIYKIVSSINIDEKTKKIIIRIILFSALITSLFGIYQFVGDSLGVPEYLTGLRYQYTKAILGFPRIQSVVLEPLYFSNFLIVPLFLGLKIYYDQKKFFSMPVVFLTLVLINIILGVSRGAFLAISVSVLALLVYLAIKKEWRKILKTVFIVLFSFSISIGLIFFLNGRTATKTFFTHAVAGETGTAVSTVGRVEVYREAWQTFRENPLGIGVASWGVEHQGLVDYSDEKSFGNVNNQYLEILVETGIIGFLLFAMFIIFYIIEAIKIIKNSSDKLLPIVILLGLLAIFIQYNFFSTLYIIYIWAFMGLLKKTQRITNSAK